MNEKDLLKAFLYASLPYILPIRLRIGNEACEYEQSGQEQKENSRGDEKRQIHGAIKVNDIT